jgi:hypothetical protein
VFRNRVDLGTPCIICRHRHLYIRTSHTKVFQIGSDQRGRCVNALSNALSFARKLWNSRYAHLFRTKQKTEPSNCQCASQAPVSSRRRVYLLRSTSPSKNDYSFYVRNFGTKSNIGCAKARLAWVPFIDCRTKTRQEAGRNPYPHVKGSQRRVVIVR